MCVCVCVCACMCMHVYICVRVCVCMCVQAILCGGQGTTCRNRVFLLLCGSCESDSYLQAWSKYLYLLRHLAGPKEWFFLRNQVKDILKKWGADYRQKFGFLNVSSDSTLDTVDEELYWTLNHCAKTELPLLMPLVQAPQLWLQPATWEHPSSQSLNPRALLG